MKFQVQVQTAVTVAAAGPIPLQDVAHPLLGFGGLIASFLGGSESPSANYSY